MRIGLGIGLGILHNGGGIDFSGTVPECSPDVPAATWHLWEAGDEPDLVLWCRADLGVTKDGSDRVSVWEDQVGDDGSNKDATEGDAGQQPLWTATDANLNNRASITWAIARNDRLTSGTWSTPMPATCTWIVVGRITAFDASGTFLLNGNPAGSAHAVYYTTDSNVHSYAGTDVITNPFTLPALPQNIIRASVFSRTAPKIYHNALTAKALSGGATDTGAQTLTALVLGGQRGDATGFTLAGSISEVIGLDVEADQTTVERILRNLGAYYGVPIGA